MHIMTAFFLVLLVIEKVLEKLSGYTPPPKREARHRDREVIVFFYDDND
ncbi:MAG: hypothetical protein WHV44_08565 [Anaerolineales bacterium]